jgi:fatty-acyl-CoA synthase
MNLAHWIDRQAARRPDKIALRAADATLGYAELAMRCERLAAALAGAGVKPGARVAWLGCNSAAMLATLFACARVGAIFMPLNWRLAPPEHRAMLAEGEPRLLVVEPEFVAASVDGAIASAGTACVALGTGAPSGWSTWAQWLDGAARTAPRPDLDPAAPLLLCYTSGSTGRPKGVLLSHAALAANADASVDMHGLADDDRVLTTLPLFHVGGLNIQTTPALRQGCTVSLHPKFDPDAVFDVIERERITLTVLVPAQLEAMIAHPRWAGADLSSLKSISTGSTIVPERLFRAVHARGVPMIQVWGATETCPIASYLRADEAFARVGSAGRAALGCALRIVDPQGRDVAAGMSGEVLVSGGVLMNGYWRDPAATAAALAGGWYHSGDAGHLDADGFLTIDGRLKDMIISGGENVSPAEVESVILECPEIAEAAVVGRPDPRWGEQVVAVVAPRPGALVTRERVIGLFDGRLARFKTPRAVLVVDALPRTALGKVRKEDVRRLVAARLTDAVDREGGR